MPSVDVDAAEAVHHAVLGGGNHRAGYGNWEKYTHINYVMCMPALFRMENLQVFVSDEWAVNENSSVYHSIPLNQKEDVYLFWDKINCRPETLKLVRQAGDTF